MRLTVLGSNGTYPTPGRPASGYLVEAAAAVWLDAGPGTLAAFLERRDPADLDALMLSHVHGDHCLDVLPLFNLLRYGAPRPPLPVFAPAGVMERLAAFAGAGPGDAFYRVFAAETVAPGDHRQIGDLRVAWGAAVHPVPALVTRLEGPGASLAYSGDTGPGGDLVSIAGGADLLLCEASGQGDRTAYAYPHHLTAGEAGASAAAAGVRRLLVTHVPPTLDETVSVAEAAARFEGPVEWAAPGLEVLL